MDYGVCDQAIDDLVMVWDFGVTPKNMYGVPIVQLLMCKLVTVAEEVPEFIDLVNIIPCELAYYCGLVTEGNPGMSQVLLKEVLMKNKGTVKKCIKEQKRLPSKVLVGIKQSGLHPVLSCGFIEWYECLWEAQKTHPGNRVDTVEYWTEVLK